MEEHKKYLEPKKSMFTKVSLGVILAGIFLGFGILIAASLFSWTKITQELTNLELLIITLGIVMLSIGAAVDDYKFENYRKNYLAKTIKEVEILKKENSRLMEENEDLKKKVR